MGIWCLNQTSTETFDDSGRSLAHSVLATGQTCRNSPCQKPALPFLFSTVDILVPEINVPNKSPQYCALWPLGGEKLRERLQILTWSERAQHPGKKHESSWLCHMFLWWSPDNSADAPTEFPTTYHPEENAPAVFGQECPWNIWRFKWGHELHQFIS